MHGSLLSAFKQIRSDRFAFDMQIFLFFSQNHDEPSLNVQLQEELISIIFAITTEGRQEISHEENSRHRNSIFVLIGMEMNWKRFLDSSLVGGDGGVQKKKNHPSICVRIRVEGCLSLSAAVEGCV